MAVKTTEGLNSNSQAALSYLLGPITGVVFFIIGKDSFVKFHAVQSTLVFGALMLIQMLMVATLILIPFIPLVNLLGFVLWLVLIYKAWQGEKWVVPYVGKYVDIVMNKLNK